MTGTNDGNRPKVYQSLREQLRQFRPDMPPGEGAIADLILNFPGELAGYSASELALLAKTSKATVSRFVRRLGFDKFEDMRRLIRAESEAGSPLFLARGGGQTAMPQMSDLQAAIARNTSETLAAFDDAQLDRLAARVLSSRQVWIIGYRHGHFLAGYLRWSLAHARNGVHLLPRAGETLGESLVDAGPDDLVILVGMRRTVPTVRAAMAFCAKRGSIVAVFADSTFRTAPDSDLTFEIRSRTQGSVDEHVTLMTVLHLLVERVIQAGGQETRARLGLIDDAHAELNEF
jgi:DNA-binding MurR/RpiR family transcriptional regulator